MNSSEIDFSAQFGGSDAATAVLPHFRALKVASKKLPLKGFPFSELTFIFRVDGEVHEFGFSGAGDLEVDKAGEYIAVDIGITCEDRSHLIDSIKSSLIEGIERIRNHKKSSSWDIDYQSLRRCLASLIDRYEKELTNNAEY